MNEYEKELFWSALEDFWDLKSKNIEATSFTIPDGVSYELALRISSELGLIHRSSNIKMSRVIFHNKRRNHI